MSLLLSYDSSEFGDYMKKLSRIIFLCLIVQFSFLPDLFAANKILNVKVRTAKVRSTPKAWAPMLAVVKYGDSLQVVSKEAGWLKIALKNGSTGYLHESAVTTQRIVFASRNEGMPSFTNSSEVVLAGKGFNSEAERQLAQGDPSLNFHAVNFLEKQTISDAALAAFIKAGKLNQQG